MSSRATIPDSSSPSVLLIRLDAIGDALALTPLLAAFRSAGIPVDLVLRSGNRDAFSDLAARTRFIAPFAMRSMTAANKEAIRRFADGQVRSNGYTHVLVATEDPGGYYLARYLGARNRVGFVNGWGKPFKTLWLRTLLTRTLYRSAGLDPNAPHECEVLFQLGQDLIAESHATRDLSRLRPLILDRETERDGRVIFQVTDKWERLGIASSQVIDALRVAARARPLRAISSSAEARYADKIEERAGIEVERFDDISSWKAAIGSAAALIGPDSGAIHMAGMTGTPTVAVFPPVALFERQIARWAPWAAPYEIIKADESWPSRAVAAMKQLRFANVAVENDAAGPVDRN